MFTGIIQGQGEIVGLRRSGQECRMEVRPLFPLENIVDGESIAHNGACLSVERHSGSTFTVYASGESLSRTTLGDLRKGDLVNLERALALGDRLGGHLVSGHVDCVATVRSVEQAGSSLRCTLAFPPAFAAEVIEKGSVTLDGISLTINACGKDFLTVNVGELHFCIEAVAFRGVLSEVNGNLCLCLAFVAFAGHFTLKEHDVRAFYVERKAELELEIVNLVKDIRKA